MTESIRAFLALEVPEVVKARLAEARERVIPDLPAARWTRPKGWHLTLKFLGETDRTVLDALSVDLAPRLRGLAKVTADLSGGGFFPSPSHPRVAWIGGSSDGAGVVAEAVEAAALRAGFPGERRRWAIHLTMARLKSRWSREAVGRYLAWADDLEAESFDCAEVVLFSSRLEPGGAVYTALERFSLE